MGPLQVLPGHPGPSVPGARTLWAGQSPRGHRPGPGAHSASICSSGLSIRPQASHWPAEQPLPPPVQVPEEHFPALLAYLEGLKGQARELTVQKAEALMRELDQAGTADLGPLLWAKTRRVRQVLQLLS